MALKLGPVEWKTENFKKAFIAAFVSMLTWLIAFASPYWLQMYATVPYDFKNMGLWEVCFSTYYFRQDPFINKFAGCYWMFALELDFGKRDVITPDFFVVCQVFSGAVLIFLIAAWIILLLMFIRSIGENNWSYWILTTTLAVLTGISGVLIFVVVVTVGVKSGDRKWMPRADLIWLSWGYAFAVFAMLASLVAAAFFGLDAKQYWGSAQPQRMKVGLNLVPYRQGDAGLDPTETASVFTK